MASGSLDDIRASFRDKDGVILKVRHGGPEAARAFRDLAGVESVAAGPDEFRVEWSRGRDLRDQVVSLVVERGLGLLEMRPMAMNIEDLYLKVVSGGLGQ